MSYNGGMTEKPYYIYFHARPTGEVFYVGRGYRHRAVSLNRNRHHSNVVKKYGQANIKIYLVQIDPTKGNELEIFYIQHLSDLGHRLTNMTSGGEGMFNPNPELRARLSESVKNSPSAINQRKELHRHNTGMKRSDETRKLLSEKSKGRPKSATHRESISRAQRGRKLSESWCENLRANSIKTWSDPEIRNRRLDGLRRGLEVKIPCTCGVAVDRANFSKYHGEKCSLKTPERVIEIFLSRWNQKSIAEKFMVSPMMVSRIKRKQFWSSILEEALSAYLTKHKLSR